MKIQITGEIIDKAIDLGYLGLNKEEKECLKPWMTSLVQKAEGRCGPVYVETSIITGRRLVSFNYENGERERPLDSEGNPTGFYAKWFSFTEGETIAKRMKLTYRKA